MKRRNFLLIALGSLGIVGGAKGLWLRFQNRERLAVSSAQPAIALPPAGAPSTAAPLLRFVAIADTGTGYEDQYQVGEAMAQYHQHHPYSLVVMAGDNIYTNGEIEKVRSVFEQPYQALLQAKVKFRACLGNHDIRTNNGIDQLRYANFNMSGRYYTFREKTVQFFALDTNSNADWNAQLAWLETELQRSDAPWKIAFGHHPIYSSGVYGTNQNLVATLSPLFQKYGVQLYINGHEHNYERTVPIQGTTYLITGIGGAQLRPVGKSQWTAYSGSQYGFTAVEIYSDRIELRGIDTQHRVFDHGQILAST